MAGLHYVRPFVQVFITQWHAGAGRDGGEWWCTWRGARQQLRVLAHLRQLVASGRSLQSDKAETCKQRHPHCILRMRNPCSRLDHHLERGGLVGLAERHERDATNLLFYESRRGSRACQPRCLQNPSLGKPVSQRTNQELALGFSIARSLLSKCKCKKKKNSPWCWSELDCSLIVFITEAGQPGGREACLVLPREHRATSSKGAHGH